MAARHTHHLLPYRRPSEASLVRQLEELGWQLIEAEGALALERERRREVEHELAVVESALLRLLQSIGSEVADLEDMRLELGLQGLRESAGGGCVRVAEAALDGALGADAGAGTPGAGGRFTWDATSLPVSARSARTVRSPLASWRGRGWSWSWRPWRSS
jgi:hypothetical protein